MQKVMFPGTHMRITQDEYSTYSHAGSLARDDGGESTAFDSPVLAPFDGTVARVRTNSSHETYVVSDGPVECANGYKGIITFLFMHDNVNRVKTGQHVKQGEIIGYEGGYGDGRKDVFAHHTHREWSKGKNTTQQMNAQGTYVIANQMHEYDVCFVRPDTMIYNGSGFVRAGNNGTVRDNEWHTFKVARGDEEVKPIDNENSIILQCGPASSGDRVQLKALADSYGLGYSESNAVSGDNKYAYIGPASPGDQINVISKCNDLGLDCVKYVEPDPKPEPEQLDELKKEIERLKAENESLAIINKDLENRLESKELEANKYYNALVDINNILKGVKENDA